MNIVLLLALLSKSQWA